MFRGFLAGSLVLVVLYVVVQDGASGRVEDASNVAQALLRRLLSPDVAGIGNHAQPSQQATLRPNTPPPANPTPYDRPGRAQTTPVPV